jgi:hypothetical protein
MRNIEQIKADFEHTSYDHRIDFIDSYDFNDNFIEYYKSFIASASNIKDPLYLSELIDLARWLNLFEPILYKRYFAYLFQKRHYLVKLASLDYLLDAKQFYADPTSERKICRFLETRVQRILRNQAYLNLLALNTANNNDYLKRLKKSLNETSDWRSVYRVTNTIASVSKLAQYRDQLYTFIKNLNEMKGFGKGVNQKLNHLKTTLSKP